MEFFNINNNIISDVTPILKTFRKLKELHCKGNMISIINDEDYRNNDLNMIDLSFNKIDKESSLIGLQKINSLNMINLLNNPLTKGDWKSAWKNTIGINKIY
jgi:Leucine-rich repeat (LRR) protein